MVPDFARARLSSPTSLAGCSPTPPSSQRKQLDATTMIAFEDPNNAYRSRDPANVAIDSGKTAFRIEA